MKRRRVFTVVVEYDTDHTLKGKPYPVQPGWFDACPNAFDPDSMVTAESVDAALLDCPDGWGWFATVEVAEVNPVAGPSDPVVL